MSWASEARLIGPRLALPLVLALGLLAACGRPPAAPPPQATPSEPQPAPSGLAAPAGEQLQAAVQANKTIGGRDMLDWSNTDKVITQLQDSIKSGRDSSENYALLGAAYLQKWRENQDPSLYSKADPVLRKALDLDPNNVDALTEMAQLSASRHEFANALSWANKALAVEPRNEDAWGYKVDALNELGRYGEAIQAAQTMIDLRPDLSSYARESYIRELRGDVAGAIQAMQLAIDAGGADAENNAWTRWTLGQIYFNEGQLDEAAAEYNDALRFLPGYVHAEAGLAEVDAARGNNGQAIQEYTAAISQLPFPQYVIELGDLYTLAGQQAKADQQYKLVHAMEQLYQANGVKMDTDLALFDADHGQNLAGLVKEARKGLQERPGIISHDALAWALYQAGQYQEARAEEKLAMSTGMKNALFYFHAGMIELKLGDPAAGKDLLRQALAINPYFSIRYAPQARELSK